MLKVSAHLGQQSLALTEADSGEKLNLFGTVNYECSACQLISNQLTDCCIQYSAPSALLMYLNPSQAVTFHPNGNYLATGSSDHTCRLWDVQSGHCMRLMEGGKVGERNDVPIKWLLYGLFIVPPALLLHFPPPPPTPHHSDRQQSTVSPSLLMESS